MFLEVFWHEISYFEQILRNDKLANPVYINVFKVTGFPIKVL